MQERDDLQVIIPNLTWRFSGVTATNRTVAPLIAQRMNAAWFGSDAPDSVRKTGVFELAALAARRPRRPVVWHARRNVEMIAGLVLRTCGWPLKLVFTSVAQRRHTWTTRFLIAHMDAVIAAGETSASYLRQKPAAIILHGVDTQRYAPPKDRVAEFKAAGLPGKHAIGCFGRVRAQKGTDLFVEAMCRLLPRYPDFCAVVIGEVTPDQRGFNENLKTRVKEAGLTERVRFFGELPIDDVPAWYRRILIYAFTSRNEGFGLTLLEAMASGAALTAARAGAADKVVVEGETGFLIPPGDVDALERALEPLMRDPTRAAAIGKAGRAHVEKNYSADAEAEQIVGVYRRLLAT